MYFRQIDEIIAGTKTQTRRIVKPGEWLSNPPVVCVFTGSPDEGRMKWCVGRDYAVSPKLGKPGVWWQSKHVWGMPTQSFEGFDRAIYSPDSEIGITRGWQPLRIVITAIRREPLQAISAEDAIAEGIDEDVCLIAHNATPEALDRVARKIAIERYRDLWESINGRGSWDANPEVFVIEFKVMNS